MMENDPKSSVHDEQFGDAENMGKEIPENQEEVNNIDRISTSEDEPVQEQSPDIENENSQVSKTVRPRKKKVEKITLDDVSDQTDEDHLADGDNKKSLEDETSVSVDFKTATENSESSDVPFLTAEQDFHTDEHTELISEHADNEEDIDFSKLSKEDLVKLLKDLIETGSYYDIRKRVELIKTFFYKKHKADIELIKKKFIDDGGQIQDFKIEENPLEIKLKELLERYKDYRNEHNKKQDDDKVGNLEKKYKIIEEIKELVNSQESLNRTFHEFRDLQNRWRELGPVPQQNLKDLWESYHYQVEAFYDYIKINKELRDLDLKKNLEAKMKLCENAESLILEPSVVEAFRKLQKLHDQWREIGPVSIDKRSEIWERFKDSTAKINRKHQEYFVGLKQDQKKNHEEKIAICEKAEEIAAFEIENNKDWEEKSKEIIELQKI